MKSPETNPTPVTTEATPQPEAEPVDSGGLGQLPIAVSEGDFSTPTKRIRTITRPRGLRTLEPPATPPPAQTAAYDQADIPGPAAEGLPIEETPPPPVDAAPSSLLASEPRPGPSVVDEFLAAPPTPEPEVNYTPGPELIPPATYLNEESASPTQDALENPDAAAELRRMALHPETPPTPSDIGIADGLDGVDGAGFAVDVTATARSHPEQIPDPDVRTVDEILDQATARILASPPDETVLHEVTAPIEPERLPSDDLSPTLQSEERPLPPPSDRELSPLAQTLAHMAEAMQGDLAVEEALDLDIADGPLLPLPDEALTHPPVPPPPSPVARTVPPPVPVPSLTAITATDLRVPVPGVPTLPEALAERPRRPKRSKPWFEEVFDESYLRTLPFMTADQTLREVDFIESSLGVPRGSEVLDVGCGYGRHAIELVQRGLAVTGLDLSLPLLIRAADESQRRGVSVNFVHTDMREMTFDRQFSGAYCMLTSFGYFDEESNLKVAESIARALKPGGRLLIDVINRDYVVGDLPARLWWEGEGCVVLEEVDFNFNTNRVLTHRSVVFEDGQQLEQEISIRVYSLHELGKLLRKAGFRVIEVSGSIPTRGHFFGANSRNLLILAERRSE